MALTTAGAQFIAKAVTGLNSPTLFSATNYYLCVGDSSTAFNVAQTDLVAATNKFRKKVSSVTESGGVVTATAEFLTTEALFDWEEWGSANAASGGVLYQRKVETLGTHTSAQVWQLVVTLTHTAS